MRVKLLSGGAAQGVVRALSEGFRAETGYEIDGTFSAVGAMKDKLLAGEAADLVILTRKLVDELVASGHVVAGSRADLGVVRTGIAVRSSDPMPAISGAEALRASLLASEGIYFPDPQRATAGIHFAGVLARLDIADALADRLRNFPNGATAMRALAQAPERNPIGCTQITEIKSTPGVMLVGPLPPEFELATIYSVGLCVRAAAPDAAQRFVELVSTDALRKVRIDAGFEL
ncbi:MAG: substrate-binding domain-containing protein [Betaproteobacteria bacterium]|nr:substrate-binding domain-containing protein [Betaproteobacteria bacterium]